MDSTPKAEMIYKTKFKYASVQELFKLLTFLHEFA